LHTVKRLGDRLQEGLASGWLQWTAGAVNIPVQDLYRYLYRSLAGRCGEGRDLEGALPFLL
jgi:ArsR family metal-binding transcriptional regulator